MRDACFKFDNLIPLVVRSEEDAINFAKAIKEPIVPIFLISNVTEKGLKDLRKFLNVLPVQESQCSTEDKAEFIAYNKFLIDDKIVLTGFVYKGTIRKHQRLYIGPLNDGTFE